MHEDTERRYFTVLDEEGRALPAVEYWAGFFDPEQMVHDVIPLRRFVKLIGAGEALKDAGDGMFVEGSSGRRFFRLNTGAA